MLIKRLPHVKRTDNNAKLVQTFFTEEEKELFEESCKQLGLQMSHVLRCLAMDFVRHQSMSKTDKHD